MAKKKAKKKVAKKAAVKKAAAPPTPAEALAAYGKDKAALLKAKEEYRAAQVKYFDAKRKANA